MDLPDLKPRTSKAVAQFQVTILDNGQAQINGVMADGSGALENAPLCMTACQAIIQVSLDAQAKKRSGIVIPMGPVQPIRRSPLNGQ